MTLGSGLSDIHGWPDHVRIADPSDYQALLSISLEAYRDNGVCALSMAKMQKMVSESVDRKSALALVIDGDQDEGFAAALPLVLTTLDYSDEWLLAERTLYVRPKHRHSNYDIDLIETAKALSDRWGVPYMMGIISVHRTEAKTRLLRRRMRMVGGIFIHGLDRANGAAVLRASGDIHGRL